jgi:hypothetical protein
MTDQQRQEQTARIAKLQNHEANVRQDHLTITGFFTTLEQFEDHAKNLEAAIAALR